MQLLTAKSPDRNIANNSTEQVTTSKKQLVEPVATQFLLESTSGCPKMLHQRQCQCLSSQLELKKLEYFLNDEGRDYLQAVAANHTIYEPLLRRLKGEGVYGELYKNPDTCNTLYWGLRNGHLNQSQFIENYHLLCLSLTFLTTYFGGEEPLARRSEVCNAITPGKGVTWENLESAEYKFSMINKFVNAFYIAFRGIADEACMEDTHHDYQLRIAHIAYWMYALKSIETAVSYHDCLKVSSMNVLARQIHGEEPVLLAPGFGYGDYDDLKTLRENDEHPFALWHFKLPSLDHPDGIWAGYVGDKT